MLFDVVDESDVVVAGSVWVRDAEDHRAVLSTTGSINFDLVKWSISVLVLLQHHRDRVVRPSVERALDVPDDGRPVVGWPAEDLGPTAPGVDVAHTPVSRRDLLGDMGDRFQVVLGRDSTATALLRRL